MGNGNKVEFLVAICALIASAMAVFMAWDQGRVMRADLGVPLLDRRRRPDGWDDEKWKAFERDTVVRLDAGTGRPFYVQYTVHP